MPRPTLFLLHDRGGSARSWDDVAAALDDRFEVVVLEPAGAGDGAAAWVAAQVREREPDEWLIAGHGTGGGIARIVTDWAERGEQGLIPPAGLVLVDASAGPDDAAVLRTPTAELGDPARDVLLEQPEEVARLLLDLASRVVGHPALAPAFARLIASDRVAARTRRAMLARLDVPGDDVPRALSPAQRALLTAVLARVVPQRGTDLDLAGRLDVELAAGQGDGWRFAELPPDAEAWRRGLDTIAAELPGFADLGATEQDTAVDRIAEGRIGSDADGLLTGARMALWFTDLQAAAVRMWLSHPAAQAWLRYDGFADGGDGPQKQGFTTTHAGEWETWQRDWRTGKELQA